MNFSFLPFWPKLFLLMIVSFLISYLGMWDASTSSAKYNSINKNDSLNLLITNKYTKEESIPPKFTLICTNQSTQDTININISLGEYEDSMVGNILLAFKTPDNQYMTKYEIDNSAIYRIGEKGYSLIYIPAFIFLFVGFISLYFLIRKFLIK